MKDSYLYLLVELELACCDDVRIEDLSLSYDQLKRVKFEIWSLRS